MDLEELIEKHRIALSPAAEKLKTVFEFTLSTPCVVIADGEVSQTPLSELRNRLKCSLALASEPIERFQRLKETAGFDAAFEAMTADDEVGEEFVAAWDESQKDLAEGAMSTLNDIVAMVEQARRGWEATPKRLLVVAVEGKTVQSGLVPVTGLTT